MRYDIKLKITYEYENAVGYSRHIIRLMPADLGMQQRLVAGTLNIEPTPSECMTRQDFFGNKCTELAFLTSHNDLEFTVQARVERPTPPKMPDTSIRLDEMRPTLARYPSVSATSPLHFIGSSIRAPITRETSHYAEQWVSPKMHILQCIETIGASIYRDFKFDPKATSVETPMLEAFTGRRGVCQDFAHIMIACLRGVGIPAAYVSGFLRTKPPKGKARLEGADSMHAWVAAWCGEAMGWVEYDPTNHCFVMADHIFIARGRDYFDVAPVKGIMRSYGKHKTKQSVDVIPVL